MHALQTLSNLAVSLKLSGTGPAAGTPGVERRRGRRHDYEHENVLVERCEGPGKPARPFGHLMDLSSTGLRVRVKNPGLKIGAQIRIHLDLPTYAGISPFVTADGSSRGCSEWTGWMTVTRLTKVDSDTFDVAGRLVDMREIDRGMLGLYLSAQPLAA